MTLLRDTIAFGAWFGTYGTLKARTCPKDSHPSILWLMFIGALSGEMFWLTVSWE